MTSNSGDIPYGYDRYDGDIFGYDTKWPAI